MPAQHKQGRGRSKRGKKRPRPPATDDYIKVVPLRIEDDIALPVQVIYSTVARAVTACYCVPQPGPRERTPHCRVCRSQKEDAQKTARSLPIILPFHLRPVTVQSSLIEALTVGHGSSKLMWLIWAPRGMHDWVSGQSSRR